MYTVSDRLREGCHILSGTTGRLKDMVEKGRVNFHLYCDYQIFFCFLFEAFIEKSEIFRP